MLQGLSSLGMDTVTKVQTLGEAVRISQSTNVFSLHSKVYLKHFKVALSTLEPLIFFSRVLGSLSRLPDLRPPSPSSFEATQSFSLRGSLASFNHMPDVSPPTPSFVDT